MTDEALPLPMEGEEPPKPSPGAIIKPRAAARSNPHKFTFDVDDEGNVTIDIKYKRQRKTGRKVIDLDGNEVDEYEGYETSHGFGLLPVFNAQSVEDTPAGETTLKMITRKHAAKLDEDGTELEPAWEEEVPYTRPTPRRKVVKFPEYDLIYEFHDLMLKETIIVHKKVASIKWTHNLNGGKLKKVPGTTDHYVFLTDDDESLNMKITTPTGTDAKGIEIEGPKLNISAQGNFNLVIPQNVTYTYPLTIDPSFTFDGTDFVIAGAETEVKTYQQLWSILSSLGTNVRYNGGYMAADSTGSHDHIDLQKVLSNSLDLSSLSDLTISIRTTNGDAAWVLRIYMTSTGGWNALNRKRYTKSLANDVTATYTLSDFTLDEVGIVDASAINYMVVAFETIDSAKVGNVTAEVKDLKFTTPVKTSDMYDDTGRFVLEAENCEGDDGLAIDDYKPFNATIAYATAGTSVIEIDDTQSNSGSTSLLIKKVAADKPNVTITKALLSGSISRMTYNVYVDASFIIGSIGWFYTHDGAVQIVAMNIQRDGVGPLIRVFYGNGAGGNNTTDAYFSQDAWVRVDLDYDFTNNKQRIWVDGVMYPGANADAGGWDNFVSDHAGAEMDKIQLRSDGNAGSFWIDDMIASVGFEDFSALTAPHDIDDITEAVSPSGTDYGRGTWDGDWATNGVSIAVDNTKAVIGTNSIKANDLDYIQLISYAYDTAIDISSFTNMRFYCFPETGMTTIRVYLYCTTGGSREISVTVTPNKWNYVDLDINGAWSGWDETGSFNATIHHQLFIMNFTGATNNLDLWVDGLHFYGDPAAGVCPMGNSFDLNAKAYTQDRAHYNLNKIKDSVAGSTWSGIMSSASDNLTIEFSDTAGSGLDNIDDIGGLTINGYDADNVIVLTAIGDTAPANFWDGDQWYGNKDIQFFRISFCGKIEARGTLSTIITDGTINNSPTNTGIRFHSYVAHAGDVFQNIVLDDLKYPIRLQTINSDVPVYLDNITITNVGGGGNAISSFAATKAVLVFLNSTFDKTDLGLLPTDFLMVSKNHNKNGEYVVTIIGNVLDNYSDLPVDHLPTPNDIFYLQAGTFNCDVSGQVNIIYRLEGAAGTTVIISTENGLTVLDWHLEDFLGTLTETFPLKRSIRILTRPVPLPVPLPVIASKT